MLTYFHSPAGPKRNWANLIWNAAIPPSKSFLVWRLIHRKMPTDDNLCARGCHMPSMCTLCGKDAETTNHLFLNCQFALSLWQWLQSIIGYNIDLSSLLTTFEVSKRGWSPQSKLAIIAAIINIFNIIWFCRNNYRFNNTKPNLNAAITKIISDVSLAGNSTKAVTGPSINDFKILKAFRVNTHHPNAPKVTEVIWHPPILQWIKFNTDGASLGNPGQAACVGIFRNRNGEGIGCFAVNLGLANAFYAELMGIILAVECAVNRNWSFLWIETNSKLATMAVKSPHIVP